ncbi:MAG TPA: CopG family transcriptional regulator [Dehalococcoidia bacterium]|nr:CopG family transcriptional regulator [Dehalococcoidia bacterium]
MRTTLNLDDDVSAAISATAQRQRRSLSRVVNDLLRAGLASSRQKTSLAPYDPPVFDTGAPLLDVTDVAAALDLLGDDQ